MKKLPQAEFEIMNIIWEHIPPMSTNDIISYLDPKISWKPQTVLTLLKRLTDRKFISSERIGKERYYRPLVEKSEYLEFESNDFVRKYFKNSIVNFVNTFFNSNEVSREEIERLQRWMDDNYNDGKK